MGVAALGQCVTHAGRQGHCGSKPGNGEAAQKRVLKLKHPTTHKFPDSCLPVASPKPYHDPYRVRIPAGLMPFK
jgi:hypothetical protein